MMKSQAWLFAALAATLPGLMPVTALAGGTAPVAIVEDTTATVEIVQPFDLLREGDKLTLEKDQGAIISYLDSCQRENIRGGKVVIGRMQSEVMDGIVSRQVVSCDPAALALTPEQSNQNATLAFRLPDMSDSADPIAAQASFAMATRHPVVIALDLQALTIEDLYHPGPTRRMQLVNGFAALTDPDQPLAKGGVYRLESGDRSLVFRIGREATDAPLPILKRIIRFD